MKKKFDSVQLQREIRARLSEKYAHSREEQMRELREKFGHLRKRKVGAHSG